MGIAYYGIRNNTNYVITTDGKLLSVGRDQTLKPTDVYGPLVDGSWKDVSTGRAHSLAIQSNGTLWAWGLNTQNNLAFNGLTQVSSPIQIGTESYWTKVSCGYNYSFAIQSNGTLWAWGANESGTLGNNSSSGFSTPTQIGTDSNWSQNILAGRFNSFAIRTDGTLWAWGRDTNGVLGLNTINGVYKSSPTQVGTESYWAQISCGGLFSSAIQSNGTLWSWGLNTFGALGLSDTTTRSSPVQVGTLSNWSQVACGYHYTLATKSDGTLWAWGNNSRGQLGTSNTTHRSSPVQTGAIGTSYTKVTTSGLFGVFQSQVIDNQGFLWVCGYSQPGVFGNNISGTLNFFNRTNNYNSFSNNIRSTGTTSYGILTEGVLIVTGAVSFAGYDGTSMRSSPIQIGSLSSWSKLPGGVSGTAWSLAIDNSNTLYGFGDNTGWRMNYQMALPYYNVSRTVTINDGQQLRISTPIASNVSYVSTGAQAAAYIKTDGTLWAWGLNTFSQVGVPTLPYTLTPKISTFLPNNVNSIGTGQNYSVVIQSNGTLWSWGRNQFGQLGLTILTTRSSPIQIGTESYWTQVACGYIHTLAIQSNSTLWSWGSNASGQLGLNTSTNHSSPTQVGALSVWAQIALGRGSQSLAIQSDGTLWSWGQNNFGQLGLSNTTGRSSPVQVGIESYWTQISAGDKHSLAIQSDGTLWAWGNNSFGQLGLSDRTDRSSPVQVGALSVWTVIACGYNHSLAIQSNGTLWSWGNGIDGRLGTGGATYSSPVQVGALSVWTRIAAGFASSLSIQSNGTLWAWGNSQLSQLGLNTTNNVFSPVQVGALSVWAKISTGFNHSFGVSSNGSLYVWGANSFAQLGDDWNTVYSPIQISSFSDWTQVMYGTNFAIAKRANGTLWSWGTNGSGQLGVSDFVGKETPVQIGTMLWSSIAVGDGFVAATKYDGTLWTWGDNSFGQLGQGNSVNRNSPVQVGTLNQYVSVYATPFTVFANLL